MSILDVVVGLSAGNREQTPQAAAPDETVGAPHPRFFQDVTHARSGHWVVQQSLGIWTSLMRSDQHLGDTFHHIFKPAMSQAAFLPLANQECQAPRQTNHRPF
jgi:hypothetical protein